MSVVRQLRWMCMVGLVGVLTVSTALAEGDEATGPDVEDIVAELTTELDLSEEQATEVTGLMNEFLVNLNAATETDDDEEADPQAMLSAVKAERKSFNDKMKGALGKEQFAAYEAYVDSVFQEIFEELAELKITDLVPVLDLTDEQVTGLKPVMGTAMRDLVGVLVEYGDKKLNTRTKLKLANKLKKISKEQQAGMQAVLSDDQWTKYQAMKEEQKQAAAG